jgi:hypothetical protein
MFNVDNIKASELQAAINLTAELVINDGKYEQWEGLFVKSLNDATDVKWKSSGWSEKEGSKLGTIHVLTFASTKPKGATIELMFSETKTGYTFYQLNVEYNRTTRTVYKKNGSILNGKDAIAQIVEYLQQFKLV